MHRFIVLCHFQNTINLQNEAKPQFAGLNSTRNPSILSNNLLNPNYKNHRVLNSDLSSEPHHQFHSCSIEILNIVATGCYAFGPSIDGQGGLLFAYDSQVYLNDGSFQQNQAHSGGSIFLLSSNLFLCKGNFAQDIAYYLGGSLYFGYGVTTSKSLEITTNLLNQKCQIFDSTFTGCCSKESFGAALFQQVQDLYIFQTSFINCTTHLTGGALGLIQSFGYFEECCFSNNSCQEPPHLSNITFARPEQKPEDIPKGGGAIYVKVKSQPTDYWDMPPLIDIVTYKCCFYGNNAHIMTTNSDIYRLFGMDFLFNGACFYRSYSDFFTTQEQTISIAEYDSLNSPLSISQFESSYGVREAPDIPQFNKECPLIAIDLQYYLITPAFELPSHTYTADFATFGNAVEDQTTLAPRLPGPTTRSHLNRVKTSKFNFTEINMLQSATPSYSKSPTCSTGNGTPEISSNQRTTKETVTPSYYWEPKPSDHPSETSSLATWPSQTATPAIPETPTCSTGNGTPDSTRVAPTQSWFGEVPKQTLTASISFEHERATEAPSKTDTGATWPTQTKSPLGFPTPTCSTYGGVSNQTTILSPSKSHWGEVPHPSPSATISFQGDPSRPFPSQTDKGALWPSQTITTSPSASPIGNLPLPPTPSYWGEVPNPTQTPSLSFHGENPKPSATPAPTRAPPPTKLPSGFTFITRKPTVSYDWIFTKSHVISYTETALIQTYVNNSISYTCSNTVLIKEDYTNSISYTLGGVSFDVAVFSTPTLAKDENYFETVTVSIGETYSRSFSMSALIKESSMSLVETYVNTYTYVGNESYSYTVSKSLSEQISYVIEYAPIPVFVISERAYDVVLISIYKRTPISEGINSNLILIIGCAVVVITFSVAVVVLYFFKKKSNDLNYEEGERYFDDFSNDSNNWTGSTKSSDRGVPEETTMQLLNVNANIQDQNAELDNWI